MMNQQTARAEKAGKQGKLLAALMMTVITVAAIAAVITAFTMVMMNETANAEDSRPVISEVKLTVDVPKHGTEIKAIKVDDEIVSQNPLPKVKTTSGANYEILANDPKEDTDHMGPRWMKTKAQDRKPKGTNFFEGKITCGGEYWVNMFLWADPEKSSGFKVGENEKPDVKVFVNGKENKDAAVYRYGYGLERRRVAAKYGFEGNKRINYLMPMVMVAVKIEIDHSWDGGKVTKEPTETEKGTRTYTCTYCGAKRTKDIPAKGKKKDKKSAKQLFVLTMKAKSKGVVFKWNKIKGASGYELYFSKCNHGKDKNKPKKIRKFKKNNISKWKKGSLKSNVAYKAYMKAYKIKNGKKKTIAKSPIVHAYTNNGKGLFANIKAIKVNKSKVTLNKGKKFKIKAKAIKTKKSLKLLNKNHTTVLRYKSSDKSIAKVSKNGKITAVKKGNCKIYTLGVNGVYKTTKVTVK